jgi:hypothetical protein
MNTHETIGLLILTLCVGLLGLKLMAASFDAGVREGRRREASRQIGEVIEEVNK